MLFARRTRYAKVTDSPGAILAEDGSTHCFFDALAHSFSAYAFESEVISNAEPDAERYA